MSDEYTRPFYEIVCGLNNYSLGTIIESETGQQYKLTKTDNDYRKFSRIGKGLRFLTYENMNKKFRIVEEINIQQLIELETYKDIVDYDCRDIQTNRGMINILVQAVKYLDNKLKEK